MSIFLVLLSAVVLAALMLTTLNHIARDASWLMRLLARSSVTDLILHGLIFLFFSGSAHALISAEIAGITMSLYFWSYRRRYGYIEHRVVTAKGGRVRGDAQTVNAALEAHFAAHPDDSVATRAQHFRWA